MGRLWLGVRRGASFGLFAGAAGLACANLDGLAGGAEARPTAEAGVDSASPPVPKADAGGAFTAGNVTIAPTSIDFAGVGCGESQTAPITLTNTGSDAVPYEVWLPSTTAFSLDGATSMGVLSGMVPARGTQIVNLVGAGNAPGSDAVEVALGVGDVTTQITATIERNGPGLTVATSAVRFGDVRAQNGSPPTQVVFQNPGNEAVLVTSFTGATADFSVPSNVFIEAGGALGFLFELLPGASGQALSETLTPQVSRPLCGATPTLTLQGQRVAANITVLPAAIDFGKFGCNATPTGTSAVTITNYSQSVSDYTATLQDNSKFRIVSGATGTLAAAQTDTSPTSATIIVEPNPVGGTYGDFNENLTVVRGNGVIDTVALGMHVFGAAFTVTPSYDGQHESLTAITPAHTALGSVTNTGNAPVCVTYALTGTGAAKFQVQPNDVLEANGRNDIAVGLQPTTASGSYSATLTIAHADCPGSAISAPFCNASPTIEVSGTVP